MLSPHGYAGVLDAPCKWFFYNGNEIENCLLVHAIYSRGLCNAVVFQRCPTLLDTRAPTAAGVTSHSPDGAKHVPP